MQIISCKDARSVGLKRYYTGKPCKHGHVAERHVTGGCVVCANADQVRYYWQNPERYLAANRRYHQRPDVKERNKLRQRIFYRDNAELCRAISGRCRAERLKRVPSWSETEAIKEFYANCPPGYEVDHIYPLLGETVSGLHVLANLQYLTRAANRSKRNKLEVQ
jgi:hypothetical protein